VLSQAAVCFLC